MLTSQVCMTLLKAVTEIILGKAHLYLELLLNHYKFWGFFNSFYLSLKQIPGGILWISSDSNNERIFLGLKFSVSGCFWVGKFWQETFGVA